MLGVEWELWILAWLIRSRSENGAKRGLEEGNEPISWFD